jgi:DNA replicative helicase MCM subunit Mcm2 (Cdc46/Mcm family)
MIVLLLIASLTPIAVPILTVILNELRIDPPLTTEEEEKLVEAIAKSEWARALASKMAVTPEAQEKVARMLALSLVKGIRKT